jgi:ADP-ribose pyrophosphatase YjhB (NUDIX family)
MKGAGVHARNLSSMMNFCPDCAAPLAHRIPEGDDRLRDVCDACGKIHYQNPKLVVGCLPEWQGRILMCRRAIEPRIGKWTVPAGYLENGETVAAGAERETREEAGAAVHIVAPYTLYNLVFVNQIYLMFRAKLLSADFAPGTESLEVALFEEAEIPWSEIAFAVVEQTLRRFFADRAAGQFPFFMGDIQPLTVIPREKAVFWMDDQGRWCNAHGRFRNKKIIDRFNAAIDCDPNGYFVSQQRDGVFEKIYFFCPETALFVTDVLRTDPVQLRLNTGRVIALCPEKLFIQNDALFMAQGAELFKFTDRSMMQISDLLLEVSSGRCAIRIGTQIIEIPER